MLSAVCVVCCVLSAECAMCAVCCVLCVMCDVRIMLVVCVERDISCVSVCSDCFMF